MMCRGETPAPFRRPWRSRLLAIQAEVSNEDVPNILWPGLVAVRWLGLGGWGWWVGANTSSGVVVGWLVRGIPPQAVRELPSTRSLAKA